jgi:hypothetical protein
MVEVDLLLLLLDRPRRSSSSPLPLPVDTLPLLRRITQTMSVNLLLLVLDNNAALQLLKNRTTMQDEENLVLFLGVTATKEEFLCSDAAAKLLLSIITALLSLKWKILRSSIFSSSLTPSPVLSPDPCCNVLHTPYCLPQPQPRSIHSGVVLHNCYVDCHKLAIVSEVAASAVARFPTTSPTLVIP